MSVPRRSSATEAAAPLSLSQEGLWFLDQLDGPSAVYNVARGWRLEGPLDVAALERSLRALVMRHESLRTAIEPSDEGAVQRVLSVPEALASLRLDTLTVHGRDAAEQASRLSELCRASISEPFDLSRAPLLRVRLLQLSANTHVLLWVVHHIMCDGWSMEVMAQELGVLYTAERNALTPQLAPLATRFADFARSQRRRVEGERLDDALAYWRRQLAGLKPLELPGDRPWAADRSFEAHVERRPLAGTLLTSLKTLGRRRHATVFMVLMAAFKLLLMRYCGEDDVAVGAPFAGRDAEPLEGLVGYCVNTVVLRTQLSGNPPFLDLLDRVRATMLEAFAQQEMPFERLVAEVCPQRDLKRNPLFDVSINLFEHPAAPRFAECDARPIDLPVVAAKFALTLYVDIRQDASSLSLVFRSDRFTPGWGSECLDQFLGLLEQIAADPACAIGSYTLLTRRALGLLPDPAREIEAPIQVPVMDQVRQWVTSTPQRIAVSHGERHWSYGDLWSHASSLSVMLRSSGTRRGETVAIHAHKGFGLVAAMCGVLKHGAAFLIIDPDLPRERRRTMLREARVRTLCLAQVGADAGDEWEGLDGLRLIRLDERTDELTAHGDVEAQAAAEVAQDDPAYVFFTSGSSGVPKAVLGAHKSLSQYLCWQRRTFAIDAQDRVSQLSSLSFDPLLRDVFLPLTSGATLCIPRPQDAFDTLSWLQRQAASVVHTTPSLLSSWLADGVERVPLPALRWLFLSGEVLDAALLERWRERVPTPARVVNLYGPTETTMTRCFYTVPERFEPGRQPIGQPMDGTQVLLVNAQGALCGINEPGEIVLRTPFRSLGYLNLPEETRARFRKNPQRDDEADLLYFTADSGRLRPDGQLVIGGRLDDQVKIRGVRVEPGEATSVLSRHGAVQSCVVTARLAIDGDHELVAYVVPVPGRTPQPLDLRRYLESQLPAPSVPSRYVWLDALPLLPNGKVDRRALPEPPVEVPNAATLAPRTPTELALADIWCAVLGRAHVGVHDDFFALGGHSLLAIRVVSRVRKALGVDLALRALFEHPTIESLATELSAQQRGRLDATTRAASVGSPEHARQRLLELRSRRRRASSPGAVVARRAATDSIPLSFAQEGLWFLDQLTGPNGAYNMSYAARLKGPIDPDALERSLRTLVTRHESLRTSFETSDGVAVQRVHPATETADRLHLDRQALTGSSAADGERALHLRLGELASAAFDLAQAPLLRASLLRVNDEEHVLLLVVHHIVSDGWSIGVLTRELGAAYAHETGHAAVNPLPALPVQFGDYAIRQRQLIAGDSLEDLLRYWRTQLHGLGTLELPTDRPRPLRPSQRGGVERFVLPASLQEKLSALAQREHATLFMLLLAAFQVLLMRHTGQDDVAVGVPVAGRDHTELEGLIGCFLNTVVLRCDLSGNPGFTELLARVRQRSLDAFAHQSMPFDRLVAEISPQREIGRNPLYQVSFALQSHPPATLDLPGLDARPIDLQAEQSKFDLTLSVTQRGGELHGAVSYATDLFDASTVQCLMTRWRTLLEGVVTAPSTPIASLPLLDTVERERLLQGWNQTARPYAAHAAAHQLVERQVQRCPGAVAVVHEGRALTYAQLEAQANQLAHHLRAHGARRQRLVGLAVERGLSMLVAQLAVLKSGAAYVPLDPAYPIDRLVFMADDAQLTLLVGASPLVRAFPYPREKWVLLDDDAEAIAAQPAHALDADDALDAGPLDPAYVIYTSGSTGRPKGVVVPHRAVLNFLNSMARQPGLHPGDRLLAVTTLSFDIAVLDTLLSLSVGAEITLASGDTLMDGTALRALLEASGANVLQATPVTWRMLIDAGWQGSPTFKALIGGEPLPPDLARALVERTGELWNLYGPTETTVYSTGWRVNLNERAICIGRPIDNTRVYVLDAQGQPCPTGVAGEIYIGGDGVALGYLRRPELTAERFLADPHGAPGATMYRTGDRGRWCNDGMLEHLGRLDFQVKLRGYRIELGEIEAQLASHAQVSRCVLALRGQDADARLVAYVVPRQAMPAASALRTHLRTHLPDYMVPHSFVQLDAIPLLPNGKIDRKSLPEPPASESPIAASATPSQIEELMMGIWADVLGLRSIGRHDNFFERGGHSLLAAKAMARLRRVVGGNPPLRLLFEAPTIAELALRLQPGLDAVQAESAIQAEVRHGPLPLSFAQSGLWFLNELTAANATYNMPLALRLTGVLDIDALQRSVRTLVERHEALRTSFTSQDGELVQVVHPVDEVSDDLRIDLRSLAGETPESRQAALSDALRQCAAEPIALDRAPLLRVRLWRLTAQEHVFALVVHHIVSDGWSMDVILRELDTLYAASCVGQGNPLAPLPIQYADFVLWQRRRLEGHASAPLLTYWRQQLRGLEPLQLPTDRPRPLHLSPRGAELCFDIEPELLDGLKALATREQATLFMVLLAAFQVLLMRYSGSVDVSVGVPIARRDRVELEGLVGLLVNTLVLRSDLSGDPEFVELLARVRRTSLEAYAHQELPFDKLVAEIAPQRELNRNPLYQAAFALQNQPATAPRLGELQVERLSVHNGTSKFDLWLALWENDSTLAGTLEYSTDLFDAATAERIARHYCHLLRDIVARPTQRIARLALMDEPERRQLLDAWNDTARELPLPLNLHQLFEAQVRQRPAADAVVMGGQTLSYGELNGRANRLAHFLREQGVGPDVLVGCCLHRHLDMLVAMLAIVKAGGAYVPLDPQYPAERLAFMLADCHCPVVLTEQALRDRLPGSRAQVLCVDADHARWGRHPDSDPASAAHPDHLAYVIYTSGSTGTPKGVAVTQLAVMRLVINTDYVQLGPKDVMAQVSSSSFDAATFEIWGALLNGARLVILPKEVLLSAAALARAIEAHAINTMFVTTSLFHEHAASAHPAFGGLDQLLVGGEAIDPVAVRRVFEAAPPKRLLNAYGPTETTTFAAWHEVSDPTAATVPIGRPIANTRCHVLDASLEPVPIGAIGELFIGGPGLARGYLNRPELTAERFIADPFRPGERLYRSGDRARYLGDGNLVYLGRIDRQVKLRGFRIELGEIEAALSREPGVAQCAVIVREDRPGDQRLVAYVVASTPAVVGSAAQLRDRLAARLPPYMVPSSVVVLDAMPLTVNGKLDRAALPRPNPEPQPATVREAVASDALEQQMASIWQQVLGVQAIGLDDSFFDLGGHSLLAIKLLDGIEKHFKRSLGLATFFEAPTIRSQVALLRQATAVAPASCAVAIQPRGSRPPLFFVSGHGGAILPFRSLARELGSDQPLYVLDMNSLGPSEGEVTLEGMASRMLDDMRRIQPHGPYHLAGFSLGGKIVFEMAQQLHRAAQPVGLMALLDCAAPGARRLRPFPVRVWLHLKQAAASERREAATYLLERLRRLRRYFGPRQRAVPKVFKTADIQESSAVARAIEMQAARIFEAWQAYVPASYPGRITLVKAQQRDHGPGVVEDPYLGWGSLAGGGVDVGVLPCAHRAMLDEAQAPALAMLLTQRLNRFQEPDTPATVAPAVAAIA